MLDRPNPPQPPGVFDRLFATRSPAMRTALGYAKPFAAGRDPILILGERGTGKTTLARYVHQLSNRMNFVSYQLSATHDDLHVSKLFGHTKDAIGHRRVTLLELVVVIVLLGGTASVSGFALAGWRGGLSPDDPIPLGRRRAIMTGQTIHFSIIPAQDSVPRSGLIRPDGRVLRDPVAR